MTRSHCHPNQPAYGRGLCRGCYDHHRKYGTLDIFPTRRWRLRLNEFATEYAHLRTDGVTRLQFARRAGMTRDSVDQAYRRAVRAGLLTPDRRAA